LCVYTGTAISVLLTNLFKLLLLLI